MANAFSVESCSDVVPWVVASSNPGLELANAFGVKNKLTRHRGSYQEVLYEELQRYVSAEKMKLLDELLAQIAAKDYAGIEQWIDRCKEGLPIIEDKWRQEYGVAEGSTDCPDAAS